jgi:radical SAM enzyme (TIGR01210 family)
MSEDTDLRIDEAWIRSKRGKKNSVDAQRPYAWLVEKERTVSGAIEDVAIIFLTNRECPFCCLMCDLWKNTTDYTVPSGAIPNQIEWALNQMPGVKHLKLYNSGSFFDGRSIPVEDYTRIASLVSDFETVIVESHPGMINSKCLNFRKLLKPDLQIAIGLETVNKELLRKLNKQMSTDDFRTSVRFLSEHEILTRAFILLKPPYLSETEGIYWAERSIDFAFECGVECCTVIPVRPGNGAIDFLMEQDSFAPPEIRSLETVLEYGISLNAGRVFADVWDLQVFSHCDKCLERRKERLIGMNLTQKTDKSLECNCIS